MTDCPCLSGSKYEECCAPFINGDKNAPTAEALLRSRYTAHVLGEVEYIRNTLHPSKRSDFDENAVRAWCEDSEWIGLDVISTEKGEKTDSKGTVQFVASYTQGEKQVAHREVAEFVREKSRWYFLDGKMVGQTPHVRSQPKIGRNDPCSCGSGKKYKKCCGK